MASAVNALNSLLRGTSIEDHEEALKLANAAISAPGPSDSPEKLTAQHAKVVALLKLDRFSDALRIIASGGDALADRCVLEHAYALYKTGDLDTAATIATSAASSRALQHIAAQVAYRDEKLDRAAAIYANLATSAAEAEEETDVRINALAVSAQRSWQGRGQSTLSAGQDSVLDAGRREDLETFETAYNAACAALSRSDVARASILLRRAQQLCEASDELSDDDKSVELLPILIQQAYALTRLGRHDDAAAVQKAIDASECEGAAKIVAATNTVVAQNAALGTSTSASNAINPYVVQRQLETALPATPTGSDRLFTHQERILRRNQYAIELQCYKFKGIQARTAKQLKQLTTAAEGKENAPATTLPETVDLGIFGAAAKAELQTGKDALRRILPLLEHRPDDVGLLLTAIQLQLQSKNAEAALGLLESFFKRAEESASSPSSTARFAPGLVALAVALYKLQGRHNAVRAELSKAIAHWQSSSSSSSSSSSTSTSQSSSSTPASLLRAAGVELLRSPNPADHAAAASAFETLYAADPVDRINIAGLVASLASGSATATPEEAERQQKLAASLTPVDQLTKGVDVAALLHGGVAVLAPAPVVSGKKRAAGLVEAGAGPGAAEPSAKKAKTGAAGKPAALSRQAKKLQAKAAAAGDGSFDVNKKLDAERWLPLRDRSSYRPPKGKKGKKRGEAAATQGGVVKEEETLALAGGAGSVRVEKAPQGPSAAAKKRKKGKK